MAYSVSIKHTPIGKPQQIGSSLTYDWQPASLTQQQMIAHITAGKPLAVGLYRDGHKAIDNLTGGLQTAWLDYDNLTPLQFKALLQAPFITQNAFIVSETFNSQTEQPRARVGFVLSEPVADAKRYKMLLRMIAALAPAGADSQSMDAGRAFCGGRPGRKPAFANLSNVLDTHDLLVEVEQQIAKEKLAEQQRQEQAANAVYLRPDDDLAQAYINHVVENTLHACNTASKGDGNETLFKSAITLYSYALGGYLAEAEVERLLISTAAGARRPEKEFRATLTSARHRAEKKEVPAPQEKLTTTRFCNINYIEELHSVGQNEEPEELRWLFERPEPATAEYAPLADPDADQQYATEYISSVGIDYDALIKSPMGTGKTELINRQVTADDRCVYMTPRIALCENIAERLAFSDYQNLDQHQFTTVQKLVICLNSVQHMNLKPETTYDKVILDEVEQILSHLLTALNGYESLIVHEKLIHLIKNAGQVLAMDAQAGSVALDWLKSIRPDIQFAVNTPPARPQRALHVYNNEAEKQNKLAVLSQLDLALGRARHTCVLVCSSCEESRVQYERLTQKFPEKRVILINGETSQSRNGAEFIRNIKHALTEYDLLIASPSLGTGIDVTTPVEAVFALFTRQPGIAPDWIQAIGRYRNCREFHVCLPIKPLKNPMPTSAERIFLNEQKKSLLTGKMVLKLARKLGMEIPVAPEIGADGMVKLSGSQERLLRLYAAARARRNHFVNHPFESFIHLAQQESYTIHLTADGAILPTLAESMAEARENVADDRKLATLREDAINPEKYRDLAKKREVIPEVHVPGVLRHSIEHVTRQDITPELYDRYRTDKSRKALELFADYLSAIHEPLQDDLMEADYAVHKRRHRTQRRDLLRTCINMVWGENITKVMDLHEKPLSEEQIQQNMGEFLLRHGARLTLYFGRRLTHSDDPLDALRWLLGKLGLKLQKIRNQKENEGMYRVKLDDLEVLRRDALHRLETIRIEKEQAKRVPLPGLAEREAA